MFYNKKVKQILVYMIIMFFSISCNSNKQPQKINDTQINYNQLDIYFQDSIKQPLMLNQSMIEKYNTWDLVGIIQSNSEIKDKEIETFPFIFESLEIELNKIRPENFPFEFNIPQIIGRYRVYKTNILKINSIELINDNINDYKNNIKSFILSHDALVNMINLTFEELVENKQIIKE